MKTMPKLFILLLIVFMGINLLPAQESGLSGLASQVSSQINQDNIGFNNPNLITKLAVLVGIALLPYVIMLLTSFIKMIVVLSLLRNALGVQQTPPNQVLTGIALLLTIYVMFPTGLAMYNAGKDAMANNPPQQMFSGESAVYIINVVDKAKEPMRQFIEKNSSGKIQTSFYQIAKTMFPEPYKSSLNRSDFIVLIPTFILSQLKAAFEIGVLH